jgi:hypothetical protein
VPLSVPVPDGARQFGSRGPFALGLHCVVRSVVFWDDDPASARLLLPVVPLSRSPPIQEHAPSIAASSTLLVTSVRCIFMASPFIWLKWVSLAP